jgi:hypothetical protein
MSVNLNGFRGPSLSDRLRLICSFHVHVRRVWIWVRALCTIYCWALRSFVKISTRLMNVDEISEMALFCTLPFKSGVNPDQVRCSGRIPGRHCVSFCRTWHRDQDSPLSSPYLLTPRLYGPLTVFASLITYAHSSLLTDCCRHILPSSPVDPPPHHPAISSPLLPSNLKVKVKFTLEQATNVHRGVQV